MPSLDSLLAKRAARRLGPGGDPDKAEARKDLSLMLWRDWAAFDGLRRHLNDQMPRDPERRGREPYHAETPAEDRLLDHLSVLGFIKAQQPGFWRITEDREKRDYLRGCWLEELGFLAMRASGADEVAYAQEIAWTVGDHHGTTEIDVLARKGDILSVVSCKTAKSDYHPDDAAQRHHLYKFLMEADYWDEHFAGGAGRAVVLVSTDLYDDRRNTWFCPAVAARARILDVDLIGTDFDRWSSLVDALRRHWEE